MYAMPTPRLWRAASSVRSLRLPEQGTHREVERVGELLNGDDDSGDATTLHETDAGRWRLQRQRRIPANSLPAREDVGRHSQLLLNGEHDPNAASRHRRRLYSMSSG